ncbi:MAG TPA: HD domain-containing protein [Devosia sp.]|uniref:HD domain-containing protein n=1 Tax=Devosia sp. TaxID=1871048 RepID=UPI002DDCDC78|nr:HD domain-containing protein [Devosia sp.]HEV2513927.1 HD domain-containing protein [Devosia sp.]
MSAARLSLAEAEQLVAERLGVSPRAAHSRFVGRLMQQLAGELGADAGLWQLVGLLHDLDYFAVDGDWNRHGVLTAAWLAGRLPDEALAAIAAHDHRTGVRSSTQLAELLRLADGLAVLDETAGRETTVAALIGEALETVTGSRMFLVDIIGGAAARHGVTLATLAGILATLPRQEQR